MQIRTTPLRFSHYKYLAIRLQINHLTPPTKTHKRNTIKKIKKKRLPKEKFFTTTNSTNHLIKDTSTIGICKNVSYNSLEYYAIPFASLIFQNFRDMLVVVSINLASLHFTHLTNANAIPVLKLDQIKIIYEIPL